LVCPNHHEFDSTVGYHSADGLLGIAWTGGVRVRGLGLGWS